MAAGDTMAMPAMAAGFHSQLGNIAKGTGDTLDLPECMTNIGGNGFGFTASAKTDWDPTANEDGTLGSLSLGDNGYIYLVRDSSGAATWVASANSTYPAGSSASESRKMGGFHYGKVRTLAQAYSAAASLATQIVPNSVWDLVKRPACDPTGMVEVIPGSLWVDIYLASEVSGSWPDTVIGSVYNAVPITGTDGYNRHYDCIRLARNVGKRLPNYQDMIAAAYGVPEGATGNTDRQNTGDHSGYGFEAVSCLNIDQPAGNIYQELNEIYDRATTDGWHDDLNTGQDSANQHGQWYGSQMRSAAFGGDWTDGADAGARCVYLSGGPWGVSTGNGLRAACDAL